MSEIDNLLFERLGLTPHQSTLGFIRYKERTNQSRLVDVCIHDHRDSVASYLLNPASLDDCEVQHSELDPNQKGMLIHRHIALVRDDIEGKVKSVYLFFAKKAGSSRR